MVDISNFTLQTQMKLYIDDKDDLTSIHLS